MSARAWLAWTVGLVLATSSNAVAQGDDAAQEVEAERPQEEAAAPERGAEAGSDPATAGEAPDAPDEVTDPLDWDTLEELDAATIDRRLEALAAAAGSHAELVTIGTSRGERPVRVLTLTRRAGAARAEVPAVLFADAARRDAGPGAEAVLALGRHVVRHLDQAPFAELLSDRALMLAPALDPDVHDPEALVGADGTRFDANFPLGWRPAALRPGSGDYPLSDPAAEAVASWLAARRQVGFVLTVREPPPTRAAPGARDGQPLLPWAGAELPQRDARVFAELQGRLGLGERLRLVPWDRIESPGGGFLDFVYQGLGIFPAAWEAPDPEAGAERRAAFLADLVGRAAALLEELPHLELAEDAREELTPGLWQLDVALGNAGPTPTSSALAVARRLERPLEITVEGARLVATARRTEPGEPFRVTGFRRGDASVEPVAVASAGDGVLGGGETGWLRLVVEAPRGSELVLTARSERAGTARLELVLE